MERAALSLAASLVSPIFGKLGDKAASYFGGDITEEEVQNLQNIILPKIRTVLRVAAADPVDELKPWLMTLQAAAYEAEDVLDMYEYKRLKAQVSPLPAPLKKLKKKAKDLVAPLWLKTELKKTTEKLGRSADEADKLISLYGAIPDNMKQRQPQQQQKLPTISSASSPVFGRDEERESLVNMLIPAANEPSSSQRSIPVLAVYGIGGAGKTTLAQYAYNHRRVKEHFDRRMWVHVSRVFDARKVTTEIIESLTKQGECSNITSLDVLQMKLRDLLKSKKFLLVLDDVWCHDNMQWDQMLVPLNEVGDTRSRILVTTRTEEVASMVAKIENAVALKDLKYKDCVSIFKYYSFGDANKVIDNPELAILAEQIMNKLKKSPLSARMVGSLLRRKPNVADWQLILKKDEMLKEALGTLYLSFDNLAPHLQRCFALCSLFPKGHRFSHDRVENLVRVWIAQGFVEAPPYNNKMTIEDTGMQYFDELVSNSFFQKETTSYRGYKYVIHDLLHDLAEVVSKDHCFRIEDDTSCEHIPTTVMHLSILSKADLSLHIIARLFELVNLRTVIIHEISEVDFGRLVDVKNKMFEKFKKLRVLHLGYNRLSELYKSIGQLKHLRSLQAYVVERLPESLGRLYHLQFLDFENSNCEMPKNLNNLINLRSLIVEDGIIPKIPSFGKLTSLQGIGNYTASREKGHGIGQLKNLQQLRGRLSICNLENLQDMAEASEASLKEKKLLDELTLEWEASPEGDGSIDVEVINGLEPPPNLNLLGIRGYNGVGFPVWWRNEGRFFNQHLSHLSKFSIDGCPKLRQVRSLPSTLKELEIEHCKNLCEVPSLPLGLRIVKVEHCPKLIQLSPFPPNLEELEIIECPGVEALLSNILLFEGEDEQPNNQQQPEKENNNQQQFPLKTLTIRSCSSVGKIRFLTGPNKLFASLSELTLDKLPWLTSLHLHRNLTSLESISIDDCENLELFGSSLASTSSLRKLHISGCPRLMMQHLQPDRDDGSFLLPSSLQRLKLHNCGDPEMNLLGRCLLGLTSLKRLEIGVYSRARFLPDLANPVAIEILRISDCPELTSMWNLEPFPSVKKLQVMRCPKLTVGGGEVLLPSPLKILTIDDLLLLAALLPRRESLNSLRKLTITSSTQSIAFSPEQEELPQHPTSLTHLYIYDRDGLPSLPFNLEKLPNLRSLHIRSCRKIESLPNLPASLRKLFIWDCYNLTSLPVNLEKLPKLWSLGIRSCPEIESLPNLPASLQDLSIAGCHNMTSLPVNLEMLSSLKKLSICDCPKIKSLPNLPASLEGLSIGGCDNLTSLPVNLEMLSSLKRLLIWHCPKIQSLPNLPACLERLDIHCHPHLKKSYRKNGPLSHKVQHIRHLNIYTLN